MHKSDRVYFGKTLRFRRSVIGKDECAFENRKDSIDYLSKVYLHLKGAAAGKYGINYYQYYQPLPSADEIYNGRYKKQKIKIKCTVLFNVSYAP